MDSILFNNQWIQIRKKKYYVYAHLKWCNGTAVAILPFRKNKSGQMEYLGRYEICPPHGDGVKLCSITGGYDNADRFSIRECALNELVEEAGYCVSLKDLIDLGTVFDSKSTDTVIYMFAIDLDLADIKKVNATGDGTIGEEGAFCDWVTKHQAINCNDPLLITMVTRADQLTS
jgi:hypothetical protein